MSQARYRVTHTPRAGGTTTDITEAVDVSTREGIESTIDSFSLRISERGLPVAVRVEDVIKIYFDRGGAAPTTLVMDGVINSSKYESSNAGKSYVINGVNKLEHLMHNVIPAAYSATQGGPTDDGWTASQIVGYLIDRVNMFNTGNTENWTNIGKDITATTTKVDYFDLNKPMFHHLEEVSKDKYTKNGTYIYYLDTTNQLVWKPRPVDTDGSETGTIEEGVDAIKTNITHSVFGVINALAINCGIDLNGRKITTYAINTSSIGRVGFKWKYVSKTNYASDYIARNPSATNADVRSNARADAKDWGEVIVLPQLGAPRYKAVIEVRGSTSFVKGDVYKLQMRNFTFETGNTYYNLRLKNLRQNFSSKEGWITTVDLEEDEDTALENL